jgi:hypothetical protein
MVAFPGAEGLPFLPMGVRWSRSGTATGRAHEATHTNFWWVLA